MGHITIGDKPVSEHSDSELAEWLGTHAKRKPRADTVRLRLGILRAFDENSTPQSVRQMFYALETRGYFEKEEKNYRKCQYQLLCMRRLEIIPYSFISDSTRWMRKPRTYDSLDDYLVQIQQGYRRSLWAEQDDYVEVWMEKDALAGIVFDVTQRWDVPLMVTRGFSSETFAYEAAENIRGTGKAAYIYYLGDFDPSGKSASNSLKKKLAKWSPNAHFEHVAVTPAQVKELNLPTRPTKRTDSRSKNWHWGSVELDAIPADRLREMVEACILRHIDPEQVRRIERTEALERKTLTAMLEGLSDSG